MTQNYDDYDINLEEHMYADEHDYAHYPDSDYDDHSNLYNHHDDDLDDDYGNKHNHDYRDVHQNGDYDHAPL